MMEQQLPTRIRDSRNHFVTTNHFVSLSKRHADDTKLYVTDIYKPNGISLTSNDHGETALSRQQ